MKICGIEIDPSHLTATFTFEGVSCRVGKFDPYSYPKMQSDKDWRDSDMDQHVFDQLTESGAFSSLTLMGIGCLPSLADYIVEDSPAQAEAALA